MFPQRDPIGIWGDAGNFGNGYAFVNNDPINKQDSFGDVAISLTSNDPGSIVTVKDSSALSSSNPSPVFTRTDTTTSGGTLTLRQGSNLSGEPYAVKEVEDVNKLLGKIMVALNSGQDCKPDELATTLAVGIGLGGCEKAKAAAKSQCSAVCASRKCDKAEEFFKKKFECVPGAGAIIEMQGFSITQQEVRYWSWRCN